MCGSCSWVTVWTLEYMISTQNLGFTPRHQLAWSRYRWHQVTLLVQALTPHLLLEASVSCYHDVPASHCGSYPGCFSLQEILQLGLRPLLACCSAKSLWHSSPKWSESWCASAAQKLKALTSRSLTLPHLSTTMAVSKSTRSLPTP